MTYVHVITVQEIHISFSTIFTEMSELQITFEAALISTLSNSLPNTVPVQYRFLGNCEKML